MKLVRELWYIFSLRERVVASILLIGMTIGALFEAVSIGLVAPFVAALNDPTRIFDSAMARPILATLNIDTQKGLLVTLGLVLVGVFVLKSTYLVLLNRWLFRFVCEKQVSITRQLLTGYLNAPYTFHLQRNSAETIKGTTETIQRFIAGFLIMLLIVLAEVLVVVALAGLLLFVKPLATLGVVVILGIPTVLSYRLVQHKLAAAGRLADRSMASMIQWTEQAIGGIKEIALTGQAAFFIDRHGYHTRHYADSWRTFSLFSNIPRLIIDTITVTSLVSFSLIILLRGQDLQSVLPVLGIFAVAALRIAPSMNRIAIGMSQLRFHYVTVDVLYNDLRDLRATMPADTARAPGQSVPRSLPFTRSLVLEHLSYRYPSMPQLAVDDISLEIPKGSWVAFIGPTGAGKTTLIDLMLGLFVPDSGRILVDGRDMADDVSSWQRNIGYVPQDVYLLDDNVRRNVAFGLPDDEIDDERVWRAIGAAEIEDLVRALPDGLNAMIGQRGERLSGGERQRLGLARALYRDPEVLVIDEGTANLDNETEAAIVRTLAKSRGEKTIIVITHRLPLARNCDHVYLLRRGKVHHSGDYSDLLETDVAFRQFVESTV